MPSKIYILFANKLFDQNVTEVFVTEEDEEFYFPYSLEDCDISKDDCIESTLDVEVMTESFSKSEREKPDPNFQPIVGKYVRAILYKQKLHIGSALWRISKLEIDYIKEMLILRN